ncbi:MAG TPA: S8 family serine peptidase [Candidatus Krumholzibacteria bacterium]
MRRYNWIVLLGVLFVGASLLVAPVFAQNNHARVSMTPALEKQIEQAAPDQMISAVVKLREVGPPPQANLGRSGVLQRLRDNADRAQAPLLRFLDQPSVKSHRGLVKAFWIDNLVLVQARKDVLEQIARRPDVVEMFDNFTLTLDRPSKTDDGPSLSHQSQPWDNIAYIGAKQVWQQYGLTGTGIKVGGLDTGVDIAHPDIAGKMYTTNPADPHYPGGWAEFDANGNLVPNSVPHDSDQHGTHTSGTMIGGSASGWAIGVAPGAKLIHGLVIPGGSGSFTQVAGGMQWIIDPDNNPLTNDGADVVNMSLGATGTFTQMVAPTDNMVLAGVFPSFSIGNSGPNANTTGSPGNVPSAYGVGATNNADVIASFSSRGPVTWNFAPYVGTYTKPDISAPGVAIFSAIPGGDWEGDWNGTSMAAPHVAGTVALIRQANPSLSVDAIKQIIAQTALDLGTAGMDNNYGWGRINAFAAVSAALAGVGTLEGTVTDAATSAPLLGVQIRITDTGQRVFTDAAGHYSLRIVAGPHTVEASKFGYGATTAPVTIDADVTSTQNFALNQLPSGVIAGTVTDAGTLAGISATISVKLAGVVVMTGATGAGGAYSFTLPVGTYDLVFNPSFPYPLTTRTGIVVTQSATTTVNVALDPAEVLVVDDDAGDTFETYYQQAIAAAGRSYLTVSSSPSAADMALFEAVVWLTGNDYQTTLTAADEAALTTYLNGGGRLFMSGQDIGYDIGTDAFFANYLHADYVQDDVALGAVDGNPASAVGTGLSFDIKGGTGANNQAYADELDPLGGAITAFSYDPSVAGATFSTNTAVHANSVGSNGITSSGTAGLSYEGTYRLVYFGFGFEAVATESDRTAVMDRVLDWLQGFPKIAHTPLGDTENTTQPYVVKAMITSDYFPLAPATCKVVYSADGAPDVAVTMTPTGTPNEFAGSIPAQPSDTDVDYYISAADVEGHVSTHPLGAPALRHHFTVAKDMVDPVIVHTPLRNTNDRTGPYTVRAQVTDNIGIEAVYLLYSKNGGLYHRVEMVAGDPPTEFTGAIPGPTVVGDQFDYYILAMDESYSGNVTRHPATGTHHFSIVEEFVWDFETDDGGFTPVGNVWQWGAPTSGPGAAHSGSNVWATILGGNYPNSANATLTLPPIMIAADRPYSVFSFWHWYNMENEYDGGNVKVSTDGGATFTLLTPARGYDGTARTTNAGIPGQPCFTNIKEYWQQDTFDLSPYAGQEVVLRLHFGSDGSVVRSGWYVDDMKLRSSNIDDAAPSISNVVVPPSSFNAAGPYPVSATINDLFSGVAGASMFYSVNGGAYTEVAMTHGSGSSWSASVPGQPAGSRISLYLRATDNANNVTVSPAGAPGDHYAFAILPSAETLVIVYGTGGATTQDYRTALEANGHQADYWNQPTQGALTAAQMQLYKMIILDSRSGISGADQTSLAAFVNSGTQSAKKRLFMLGRDLAYSTTSPSTRAWVSQYLRADFVQDNPNYFQITGEAGDPIGMGESFTITGSYPDELQRSALYPGGVIVYKYTGPGGASDNQSELRDVYSKDGKEYDGVVPHAPISLDAAAAIRYNGSTYRSVLFAFNLEYMTNLAQRADIVHRVINWTSAPDIVHTPMPDTENTSTPYAVKAKVYSDNLDPSRIKLTYDLGGGSTELLMTPTGVPNEYAANIPAQPFGTTVNYFISAANLSGAVSYDPAGAPTDKHTFKVISDNIPPEITHVALPPSANLAGPYKVSAKITDNVGVDPASVALVWNKNGGTNATVPMAAVGGDMYEADIPGPSVVGDTYSYFINARDLATVPNIARSPATGYHSFPIVDFIAFDFEGSNGGFAKTGPDWEWGDPIANPADAHSGTNAWATKLNGNYSASSNSKLDTPPIVVPSSKPYALMSFWHWYDTEQDYDGGNVKISTNGGSTWTLLTPDIGYNGTGKPTNAGIPNEKCFSGHNQKFWQKATVNLTPYRGQSVLLRFHFGSDGSVHYSGWTVDDVLLEAVDDTAGPTFVSRTMPASTLDTTGPYTVKATVVDALSGVGSVVLRYSTNGGASYTAVAMSPTANPNEYSGNIPGQPTGTRVKVYLEATDVASNSSLDPAGAPATTHQFGILPTGDFLVVFGGTAESDPSLYAAAFATLGRTYDTWDWDTSGVPPLALLNAYDAIIVDESSYFDAAQIAGLTAFLDTNDGSRQQVFFLGRDMQFGSTARPFMEKYTGTVYVQDNPAFFRIKSTPGDPIGADETFVISGSFPDELKKSTTYPGAVGVYKYNGVGASVDPSEELDYRAFIEKEGKEWDPKMWPMAPTGPDSLAAVRYVGTRHSAVYFAFNFYYIQEPARRAAILGRALDWLASTATVMVAGSATSDQRTGNPTIPDKLTLNQNYPNPFNPSTHLEIGIPAKYNEPVSLKIYNVQGQLVKTVFEGIKPAGFHSFAWTGTDERGVPVASGVYFARFTSRQAQMTRKMVLLK